MDKPFQLAESREIYRGRVMRLREDHVVLPRGSQAVFNVVEIRPGSTVLAMDEGRNVKLIREYKWAVDRPSVEAISGGIEDGESPLDCAKRELLEEGGWEASDWTDLGYVDPFTSHVHSPNYIYLAQGLRQHATAHEEGEVIQPLSLPLETAVQMALRGEITHAASVIAILKVGRMFGM
jgi:ADP-ribose pyrophosphatase